MQPRRMKYNPAFLTQEELIESFVVRHADLELILGTIRENVTESNQHVLVIGPRGIGKTMLVLRVVAEVRRNEELCARWYPIVFAEESYEVATPGEFWLEALFHLGQQTKEERWRRTYDDLKQERDDVRLRERALGQLMDFADAQGKRLLLVVENLNMLLGDQLSHDDAWVLRHTLQHEPRVMLLASATSRFDETENSGKAMFEAFKLHQLEPLNLEECRRIWASITGQDLSDQRIRPVQILTGGSPRLLTIISTFGAGKSFRELMQDLTQLVDDHTEYFKTHLDNLAPIERKVYLALAEIWDPATAREIAKAARLDVNKTSSLLSRLIGRGAVTLADGRGRSKWYRVAERLYNVYYLMRRRGTPSMRVKAVVNFLISFYNEEDLIRLPRRIMEEASGLDAACREDHYAAVLSTLGGVPEGIRVRMFVQILQALLVSPSVLSCWQELKARPSIGELGLVGALAPATKHLEELENCMMTLKQAVSVLQDGEGLRDVGQLAKAARLCGEAARLYPGFEYTHVVLGLILHRLGRHGEAELAYRKAIELEPGDAEAWARLGALLGEGMGRPEEGVAALRKAIELKPNDGQAWELLGILLYRDLKRPEEAVAAYRKIVELNPSDAWAWIRLGSVLHGATERYEEAQEAYRKAALCENAPIEARALAWIAVGRVSASELGELEEGEAAYRNAIRLGPSIILGWCCLVYLLARQPERAMQAVEVAEEGIKANPNSARLLNAYASIHHEVRNSAFLERAEAWARRAVELEPSNGACQHTYASILCALGKGGEALVPARRYFDAPDIVEKAVDDAIALAVELGSLGLGREVVEIIEGSPSARFLEPLVVGLRLFLGEEVRAATEIVEVGKDVAERIGARRDARISSNP